jgi:hypothetical protein
MNQRDLIAKYGNPVLPYGDAGWRVPDPDWLGTYTEPCAVTMYERADKIVLAHYDMAETMQEAFIDCNKYYDWRPQQFYCWSPRHKMLDPKRGLSLHAWGLAFDVDWDDNGVGTPGNLPYNVVAVFKDHGFTWGGDWPKFRDPMHFQWRRL